MTKTTLPRGWALTTLGGVCSKAQYGWTTSANGDSGSIRLLRTTDITRGPIDWTAVPFCSDPPNDIGKYRLGPGDIVISRAGSVGISYLLSDVPVEAVFASYLIRFHALPPIEPRFVFYFLQTPSYWSAITDRSAGIALENVNAQKLETIEIPIAPELEQRRLVLKLDEVLTDIDAGLAALKRARANLRRYRAAVLKAAVEGRLTKEWRAEHPHAEPASKLLERILAERRKRWEQSELKKYSEKGRAPPKGWKDRYPEPAGPDISALPTLPNRWCWASWSQVGFSQNGRPFSSKDYCNAGIRLLRPGNFYASGTIGWSSKNTKHLPERYAEENADLLVAGGEIVMNLTAQSLKDDFLGRVCMAPPNERCLLNQRLARLTPILVLPRFALWLFKSPWFRRFVSELNTGSLIQHMFTSQLERFVLPLPPLQEQKAIVELLEERLSIIEHLEAQMPDKSIAALNLRRAILKSAFEGKLLPQDPNDEPASELLARLRGSRAGAGERVGAGKLRATS